MREKHRSAASRTSPTGDVPATQVRALDRNRTWDPSVRRLTLYPLSQTGLGGNGFLKRTSLVFTLARNLGEVCQFDAFLGSVCCECVTPMPNQVYRGFRHLEDADSHTDLHSASYQRFLTCSPACFSVGLKKSIATEAAIRNSYFFLKKGTHL
uniref:Uncharacterized protein n=1 Tax=Myotis myotis TaxID=51298 RepID=A0A7J7TTT1_MYOMY|nr:hypothetical protein mMyoMyo1_008991 [Myotis myotis]